MHLVYLDESGDPGSTGSPTDFYLIAGLAVDAARWSECHRCLAAFRSKLHLCHGLDLGREMHANEFLGAAHSHLGLGRIERLAMARAFLDVIPTLPGVRAFGWSSSKESEDVLERVASGASCDLDRWSRTGVLGGAPEGYLIIHDTFGRRPDVWVSEYAPPRIGRALDDDSAASLFLQAADFIAYAMRQNRHPNSFMRSHGGRGLLHRLDPISLGFRDIDNK